VKRAAIRTSRKRVEAILKRREAEIRADEQIKEHDRCVRAMYRMREVGADFPGVADDFNVVWLSPKPQKSWLQLDAMTPPHPLFHKHSNASVQIETVTFEARLRCYDRNGVRFRWIDWEPKQ